MPFSSGPNVISDSSVVFNYDVSDISSYKGQPGTNITTGNNLSWVGDNNGFYSNGKLFKTFGYSELADIPTLGRNISVNSMIIYNVYSGYGTDGNYNCCPNLFSYGGGRTVSPNTVYSYQIIYRCDSGYTHPNFMYHYEYTSGGSYLTEYGVFDTSLRTYLGDGWYHAWNTFTTNASAGYINTGMWYYQYNVTDKVSVAAISIAQGSTIRPPQQLISSNTTRSNTEGLLDISGRGNSIDISNMSYDSNGQIYFDGTNDYSTVASSALWAVGTNATIETVLYRAGSVTTNHRIWCVTNNSSNLDAYIDSSTGGLYMHGGVVGTNAQIPLNTYLHVVVTYNGGTITIYYNGIPQTLTGTTTGYNISGTGTLFIGQFSGGGSYYFNGKIPIFKTYNRALSSSEVLNNYTEYGKRFGLPIYTYDEGSNAAPYVSNWNNSTTYTMATFGGIPNVTAHGFSSGPVTYTLTLNNLPPHTKVRYKVFWHLVDSLDNETNQLFIMNSSGGETEILRFTKQYNLTPSISVAASPGTYTWSGGKTYTYRPWAGGAYGQDGYIIVDSGLVDHTSATFTARHVMGADQGQTDEAEYLSHVVVELYN
jgi:hypothetical protein